LFVAGALLHVLQGLAMLLGEPADLFRHCAARNANPERWPGRSVEFLQTENLTWSVHACHLIVNDSTHLRHPA
jgi:hypothetical protein